MNKYKKLIGNTMIFAIGQTSAKILGFLLIRIYTAVLTPDQYSTAELLYNTLNILYPIVSFSMADAILRFGVDKSYDIRKVYSSANILLVCGMTVFALTLPVWNMLPLYKNYALLLFVYCLFSSFRQLAAQCTRAAGKVKLFAADGIIAVFTQFICNLIFMVHLNMGINGYILSFICSDAFSVIFLYTAGRLYRLNKFRYADRSIIKEMLRYSLPLIPTYLLWWITSSSDRLFVIKMEGSEVNGVYATAYKLPTLLMFLTTMFYQAWQISSVEEKDSGDLGEFYSNVFNIYSSLIFTAAAFLILFAKPVTSILLSGETYSDAEKYTVILIISMVFQCFCQFLSSIYSVKKKSKNSCITALSAAVCNIILNLILIPLLGVYGAAIATAVSYFVCFLIRSADTRKYIYFKLDIARISINTALLVIMSVVSINDTTHTVLILTWLFIAVALVNIQTFLKKFRTISSLRKYNTTRS